MQCVLPFHNQFPPNSDTKEKNVNGALAEVPLGKQLGQHREDEDDGDGHEDGVQEEA